MPLRGQRMSACGFGMLAHDVDTYAVLAACVFAEALRGGSGARQERSATGCVLQVQGGGKLRAFEGTLSLHSDTLSRTQCGRDSV